MWDDNNELRVEYHALLFNSEIEGSAEARRACSPAETLLALSKACKSKFKNSYLTPSRKIVKAWLDAGGNDSDIPAPSIVLYSSHPFPTDLVQDDASSSPHSCTSRSDIASRVPFVYQSTSTPMVPISGTEVKQHPETACYNNGKTFLTMRWCSLDASNKCQIERSMEGFSKEEMSADDESKLKRLSTTLKDLRSGNEKQVKQSLWLSMVTIASMTSYFSYVQFLPHM